MKQPYIRTDIEIPIDYLEDTPSILSVALHNWWNYSYLSDLDPNENIPLIVVQWLNKYINTEITNEAIQKIRDANPPPEIIIKLIVELLDNNQFLKLEDEISNIPVFRPYIINPYGHSISLDTYVYNPNSKKFESLEIIDNETLIDEGIPIETINSFYSFHQRLMETSTKKLKLYTAQPEERINRWNKQGFIDKNSYFTDNYHRAEYYFNPEEHDTIVYYRIPENQLLLTSDVFGAKEYVTLNNINIE